MSASDKVKLGEILTLQRGYDLPHAQRLDGDVPIISSSGPNGFHSSYMAKGPGVVTGRSGTVGEVFYVKEDYWPLNTSLYVVDFKGNNPKFIYYLLQTLDLKKFSYNTGVPGVNRNDLHNIRVRPISVIEQQKIVEILSDCDRAIEILTSQILQKEKTDIKVKTLSNEEIKKIKREIKKKKKVSKDLKKTTSKKQDKDTKKIKIKKNVNKNNKDIVDICTKLEKCSIEEISKYLIKQGKKKSFPDITSRR